MAYIQRDGVRLFYDEGGSGAPPVLLVHGWCGDHTHLQPQFEHLRSRRRTITVDRRGCGSSDKPGQEYTIEAAADDLVWLCQELGVHRPVVVVHSMDAIGLDLAARYPDALAGLALIDTPTLAGPQFETAGREFLQALRSPAYREAMRGFAEQMVFVPENDPQVKERILTAMTELPQRVIVSSWERYLDYDPAAALRRCEVPLLSVRGAFPADLDRLRALCPQLQVANVPGVGHFPQLFAPERTNAILESFVTSCQGAPSVV